MVCECDRPLDWSPAGLSFVSKHALPVRVQRPKHRSQTAPAAMIWLMDLIAALFVGGLLLGVCNRALEMTKDAHLADTAMERLTAVIASAATFLAIPYAVWRVLSVLGRLF